jgi:probable HAF family extracellular repeat protein
MAPLGWLPSSAYFSSEAAGVSADGSIVVGSSTIGFNNTAGPIDEAYRWTAATGMVGLGTLPGATTSHAAALTPDGSVIVGGSGNQLDAPFIWTSSAGMVSLADLLTSHGITGLKGWALRDPTAISADGRTIVGAGNDPAGNYEAWVITIPEPATIGMTAWLAVAVYCARRRFA